MRKNLEKITPENWGEGRTYCIHQYARPLLLYRKEHITKEKLFPISKSYFRIDKKTTEKNFPSYENKENNQYSY